MPYSTFLNGKNPTQLRGLQWLTFTDTGTVYTRGGSSDSGGGITVAWTAGGTTPCRIDPVVGNRSGIVGGRIDERSTHIVRVPSGMTVSSDDRFAIAGRGSYEVTVTHDRTDAWALSFEVIQLS